MNCSCKLPAKHAPGNQLAFIRSTAKTFKATRVVQCHDAVKSRSTARQDLETLLKQLPGMAAVLPGNSEIKQEIFRLLAIMEQENPNPSPLSASSEGRQTTVAELQLIPVPQLLGDWDLVFASNGTVVTRTPFAQTLISLAAQLPGFGLEDIKQSLTVDPKHPGCIRSTNDAVFGFGPLGSWLVGIKGSWTAAGPDQDPDAALVEFDAFKIKLTGWFGLSLPQQLQPQVQFSLPKRNHNQQQSSSVKPAGSRRQVAIWRTPYLDDTWRIGRAVGSGNVFLFRRRAKTADT